MCVESIQKKSNGNDGNNNKQKVKERRFEMNTVSKQTCANSKIENELYCVNGIHRTQNDAHENIPHITPHIAHTTDYLIKL